MSKIAKIEKDLKKEQAIEESKNPPKPTKKPVKKAAEKLQIIPEEEAQVAEEV